MFHTSNLFLNSLLLVVSTTCSYLTNDKYELGYAGRHRFSWKHYAKAPGADGFDATHLLKERILCPVSPTQGDTQAEPAYLPTQRIPGSRTWM